MTGYRTPSRQEISRAVGGNPDMTRALEKIFETANSLQSTVDGLVVSVALLVAVTDALTVTTDALTVTTDALLVATKSNRVMLWLSM